MTLIMKIEFVTNVVCQFLICSRLAVLNTILRRLLGP